MVMEFFKILLRYIDRPYFLSAVNNASNETKKVQAALNMAHLNKHTPRFQTCPACRKPCPRCSVCMMNMGSNSGYFAGQSHMMPSGGKTEGAAKNPGKKITPFGSFFSWCQTCRHGGHCDHMEGTFHIQILIVLIYYIDMRNLKEQVEKAFCYQKFF